MFLYENGAGQLAGMWLFALS